MLRRWRAACSSSGMLTVPQVDDPRTFAIIGAALEVHRVLGTGFLEIFYKDALEIELMNRGLPFGRALPEVKARSTTGRADHAQVISRLAGIPALRANGRVSCSAPSAALVNISNSAPSAALVMPHWYNQIS